MKFAYAKDAARSGYGGMGLFPCMLGAKVSALNLNVTVDAGGANIGNLDGPVGSYAGNGAFIEGVSVEQRFVQRETGAGETKKYSSSYFSAGVVGFCDNARVEDCRVTTLPNVYEDGSQVSKTRLYYYGGIAFANNGEIAGSAYAYRGGDNGVLETMGGIAYDNCGNITDSYAEIYANGATGIAVGGITCVLNGGEINNCATHMNVDALLGEDGRTSVRIGGLVSEVNWPRREYLNGGAMRIDNCRVTGGNLAGDNAGGLVAHVSNGTGGDNAGFPCFPLEISGCEAALTSVGTEDTRTANCGGLIGTAELSYDLTVTDCTTTANVFGGQNVGGILGAVQYRDRPDGAVSAAGVRFTMVNCHSYAKEVAALRASVNSNAGGAVGMFHQTTRTTDDASTYIDSCTTSANVTANGSCVGGFVGNMFQREIAAKPVGREYTLVNCAAYGNVTVLGGAGVSENASAEGGNGGGFIGHIDNAHAANIAVKDCSASGNVVGSSATGDKFHHMAGFIGITYNASLTIENCTASGNVDGLGGLGGFGGRLENAKLANCTARGAITGEWGIGGFIGYMFGSEVTDCTAYGNVAEGESKRGPYEHGGFFGFVGRNSSVKNCKSFGDVSGSYNIGGFGGSISIEAEGHSATLSNCVAYGSITATGQNGAGFVSVVTGAGTVRFTDCTAYGDVTSSIRASGFVSFTEANVKFLSFTRCAAYGDGISTRIGTSDEAGGFAGWVRGGGAEFLNCTAAGSVLNGDGVTSTNADCGGFIGILSTKATIDGCRASAQQLLGSPTTTGTFIGACYQMTYAINGQNVLISSDGTVIKNCQYRALTGIPMIGNATVYGGSNRIDQVDAKTNNTVNNAAIPGGAPALTCTIAKSAANNDITIAFANLANISGYVTEFAVSADGGRTYTQLIYTSADKAYDGYVLTPVAGVAIGGKLQAQAFNYTLKNLGGYDKNKVVVRIAFSNGFAKVFRGAAV